MSRIIAVFGVLLGGGRAVLSATSSVPANTIISNLSSAALVSNAASDYITGNV